jgi:chromate transporter
MGSHTQRARWAQIASGGLVPLTIGLVTAGGYVMVQTTNAGWQGALIGAASALMLFTKLNPLWILATGGALGVLVIL